MARAAAACIPSSRTSTPSTRCNSGTYQSSSLREARASTELIDARPSATRPVPASSSLKQGSPADLFKTARQEEHHWYAAFSEPRLSLRPVLEDGLQGKVSENLRSRDAVPEWRLVDSIELLASVQFRTSRQVTPRRGKSAVRNSAFGAFDPCDHFSPVS